MTTWKQYYAEHTKGKTFKKGEIQEHMRKLAKDYRESKGKGLSLKGASIGEEKEGVPEIMAHEGGKVEKMKTMEEQKTQKMPLPAFLKKKMKITEIKGDMPEKKEEKDKKEEEEVEVEEKPIKEKKVRRIDFSKIRWGAFTDDWQRHGGKRKYKSLEEFAKAVLKKPKAWEPMVVKRARFYKNILTKGRGLSMI